MKKIIAILAAVMMLLGCIACQQTPAAVEEPEAPATAAEPTTEEPAAAAEDITYKVAMITDYGDITDQSFNQTTYEACKAFAEANGIEFTYFKPAGDNTADRVSMIEKAADEGFNVLVMPGYAFGGAIVTAAPQFPDGKFIALDVAKGDLLETAVAAKGESYDYNPDNWNLEDYVDMSNVYCAVYQEELCGYMAGYAAVKLGTRTWASWAAWRFPLLSVTATASCRASMRQQLQWASPMLRSTTSTAVSSSAMPTSPLRWIPGMQTAPKSCSLAAAVSTPPQLTLRRRSMQRSSVLTLTRPALSQTMRASRA